MCRELSGAVDKWCVAGGKEEQPTELLDPDSLFEEQYLAVVVVSSVGESELMLDLASDDLELEAESVNPGVSPASLFLLVLCHRSYSQRPL